VGILGNSPRRKEEARRGWHTIIAIFWGEWERVNAEGGLIEASDEPSPQGDGKKEKLGH